MCPTAFGRKEKKLYNVHIVQCTTIFFYTRAGTFPVFTQPRSQSVINSGTKLHIATMSSMQLRATNKHKCNSTIIMSTHVPPSFLIKEIVAWSFDLFILISIFDLPILTSIFDLQNILAGEIDGGATGPRDLVQRLAKH